VIWCALANWGGAVHIGGDITFVLNQTREFFAKSPNAGGVGLTPEGIDNAPAYFSLVLDSPWTPLTAEDWLAQWGRGRCGASSPLVDKAYALLAQSVYRPGKPYLPCCALPAFCPTILPDEFAQQKGYTGQVYPDYNATILRKALEAFVVAAPGCQTDAFMYDLVDVAREWLSMMPCLNMLVDINATVPAAALKTKVAKLLELYSDVDDMMRTEEGFLLGPWLKNSRAIANWDGSNGMLADFYEWNSRTQISSWAGHYSRREWSGMVHGGPSEDEKDGSGYYSGRMKLWLQYTTAEKAPPASPMTQLPALKAALKVFDDAWSRRKWDESKLPIKPVGDPVAMATKLLAKYAE
jgi:alpha-N-acetylglucosaminidase